MFPRPYFTSQFFTPGYFGPLANLTPECAPFDYASFGRKGIGVTQPISGTDFPLVEPSEDVRYLLADFQLNYEDPADYDAAIAAFTPPFRVAWMYGFGCKPSTVPGDNSSSSMSLGSESVVTFPPSPVHDVDIVVFDADDRVVFDSTTADTFTSRDWGPRLHIFTWSTGGLTCRLVRHTKWSRDRHPRPRNYPIAFLPENATLDARTIARAPRRIKSLRVVLDQFTLEDTIELTGGYNMTLVANTPVTVGRRHVSRIEFKAIPGDGLGTYPGCDPAPLYVRAINGQRPTATGHFYMAAAGCYFLRQPTLVIDETTVPSATRAPYAIVEDLPDELAGTTIDAAGWPASKYYGQLQLGNNCTPCCDCDDYVATAAYMNELGNTYAALGADAAKAGQRYRDAHARWETVRNCVLTHPLQIILRPQYAPFLDVAVQFNNVGSVCLHNVTVRVTLSTVPEGGVGIQVTGYTFISGPTLDVDAARYVMGGEWPEFTATWDSVPPGTSVNARFRLVFDGGGGVTSETGFTSYAVTADAAALSSGIPIETQTGDPITVSSTAVMRAPTTQALTFAPTPSTTD